MGWNRVVGPSGSVKMQAKVLISYIQNQYLEIKIFLIPGFESETYRLQGGCSTTRDNKESGSKGSGKIFTSKQ